MGRRTRNGLEAADVAKGVLGRVLVGKIDGKTTCWNLEGKYRWDDREHPLDLID